MEHLSACIVCAAPSADAPVIHHRGAGDRLVRCPRCRSLFANPQWTVDELSRFYDVHYYDENQTLHTDHREHDFQLAIPLHRLVVRDLRRRTPALDRTGIKVLDYGAGVGFFLYACREVGWEGVGLEFSDVAARYGREHLSLDVRPNADVELRSLPSNHFDLVTAWQVLEHLRRPRETMRELVRILKPGGWFCAAVPHTGALDYRLRRGRWFNVENPTHLTMFNRASLSRLFADAGLVDVVRPLLWGSRHKPFFLRDLAQFVVRCANVGSELRLYARKRGSLTSAPRDQGPLEV